VRTIVVSAAVVIIARELRRMPATRSVPALILDSDELRRMLTPQPTYSAAERDWFYGVIASLAAWLTQNGLNVLIAATAHRRAYRDQARLQIARFAEVYVRCPLHVCHQRAPKGLYAQARGADCRPARCRYRLRTALRRRHCGRY
jgi:adenylylsulfate kinase